MVGASQIGEPLHEGSRSTPDPEPDAPHAALPSSRFELAPPRRFVLPALLLLLSEEPGHGYSLEKGLRDFRFGQIDRPTVYRALAHLEADGLVESWSEARKAAQARRVYRITPLGERTLGVWMSVIKTERDYLGRVLRRYQATGTTDALLAEVAGGWAGALGSDWSPVSTTAPLTRHASQPDGDEAAVAAVPAIPSAGSPEGSGNENGKRPQPPVAAIGPVRSEGHPGPDDGRGRAGGHPGPDDGPGRAGGHPGPDNGPRRADLHPAGRGPAPAGVGSWPPGRMGTVVNGQGGGAGSRRRYRLVPDRSVVLIDVRSTVGPISFGGLGLVGSIEAAVSGGAIGPDPPPTARLEIAVDGLRSGNGLYDAELMRRVDARRFPVATVELDHGVTVGSRNHWRLGGRLTFHGVTRPVEGTVDVAIAQSGHLVVTGEQVFDIRDFAVPSPTMLMLRIFPDVRVRLQVEAAPEER